MSVLQIRQRSGLEISALSSNRKKDKRESSCRQTLSVEGKGKDKNKRMKLPKEFLERMEKMLGTEYEAFLKSYEEPRKFGLRVNTAKISVEKFQELAPFHLTPIPWIPNGFYYEREDDPARHPFYYAGLYYLQEPSAMTPATVLPVVPGERVLDLCAAPGGKATALGAKLRGEGLLVANDISASRAKALLKNLEIFGISNSYVTNAVPERLAEQFEESFDKILVDAPCSGEGMFRKDLANARVWSLEKVEECAKRSMPSSEAQYRCFVRADFYCIQRVPFRRRRMSRRSHRCLQMSRRWSCWRFRGMRAFPMGGRSWRTEMKH